MHSMHVLYTSTALDVRSAPMPETPVLTYMTHTHIQTYTRSAHTHTYIIIILYINMIYDHSIIMSSDV